MKKDNQRTYSLTSKERKQKRADTAGVKPQKPDAQTDAAAQEAAMLVAQKKSKNNAVMIGSVIAVAVVLILIAILAPVIAYLVNPYRDEKNVIARFELSNGMILEYIIEEKEYDTAATNFIFLAKNGFFDNTVFFDAQKGWLRFGGYDAQPMITGSENTYEKTKHRSRNYDYCYNFKSIPNSAFIYDNKDNTLDKFNYHLRADNGGTNTALLGEIGVLAYLYSDTTTEFEFAYAAQATNDIETLTTSSNISTSDLEATRVGYALNATTKSNLAKIASTAQLNTMITSGYRWRPPSPTIYIERVKVYNLDDKKWKDFDFIKYINGNDSSGSPRLSYWSGIAT